MSNIFAELALWWHQAWHRSHHDRAAALLPAAAIGAEDEEEELASATELQPILTVISEYFPSYIIIKEYNKGM